jgi:hypothetical protein
MIFPIPKYNLSTNYTDVHKYPEAKFVTCYYESRNWHQITDMHDTLLVHVHSGEFNQTLVDNFKYFKNIIVHKNSHKEYLKLATMIYDKYFPVIFYKSDSVYGEFYYENKLVYRIKLL